MKVKQSKIFGLSAGFLLIIIIKNGNGDCGAENDVKMLKHHNLRRKITFILCMH